MASILPGAGLHTWARTSVPVQHLHKESLLATGHSLSPPRQARGVWALTDRVSSWHSSSDPNSWRYHHQPGAQVSLRHGAKSSHKGVRTREHRRRPGIPTPKGCSCLAPQSKDLYVLQILELFFMQPAWFCLPTGQASPSGVRVILSIPGPLQSLIQPAVVGGGGGVCLPAPPNPGTPMLAMGNTLGGRRFQRCLEASCVSALLCSGNAPKSHRSTWLGPAPL